MIKEEDEQILVSIKDLCEEFHVRDPRSIVKWCKKNGIPIIKKRGKRMTYQFLVDSTLNKIVVDHLKKKYPRSWKEMFELYLKNDSTAFAIADIKNSESNEKSSKDSSS